MTKFAKRLAKGVGVALAIVLSLLLVAVVVLHLPPTLDYARGFIVEQVEASMPAKLEIADLEGSVLGELTARDLVLKTADGTPLVRVERVDVDAALGTLFTGTLQADVRASHVDVFVRRDESGEVNLLSIIPESDEPAKPLPLKIDIGLDLRDVVMVWRDDGASAERDPLSALGPDLDRDVLVAQSREVETPRELARAAPHTVAIDGGSVRGRLVLEKELTTRLDVNELEGNVIAPGITAIRPLSISEVLLRVDPDGALNTSLREVELRDWLRVSDVAARFEPEQVERLAVGVGELAVTRLLAQSAVPEAQLRSGVRVTAEFAPSEEQGASLFNIGVQTTDEEGSVDVAGTASGWSEPGPQTAWDLTVATSALRPSAIAGIAKPLDRLSAWVRASGRGIDPATLTAEADVAVRGAEISRYSVGALATHVEADAGSYRVRDLMVATPYASANARGRWASDGAFEVTVQAHSTDAVAAVAKGLFGREIDTRADLWLEAKGELDPSRDDPIAMLEALDATAEWDVHRFVAEDVRVDSSRGRLNAAVEAEGADTRRVVYDVDASARNVRTSALSVGSVSVDSNGSSVVTSPSIDTMSLLRRLRARADVDVTGLVSGDTLVRDVDVLASVRPRGGRTAYELEASVQKMAFGGAKIDDAAIDLGGDVLFGRSLSWPGAVKAIRSKGDISGRGMRLAGDAVGTLDATVDIHGPLSDLAGAVKAETRNLSLAGYQFEDLSARVEFTGERRFEIEAAGTQKDRKPAKVSVFVRGTYRNDLTDFTVTELRFSTVGDGAWEVGEGFSFDTKTGTFRFKDVVISRGGQRIRVDGVFQTGKEQNLTAEFENVEVGAIAEEFGIEALQKLRATVDGKASVGGTATDPIAEFEITVSEVHWEEYGPFRLYAKGRYGDVALTVERFEVDGYDLRLAEGDARLPVRVETTGRFEVLDTGSIDVKVETPRFAVEKLREPIPQLEAYGAEGEVGMEARVKGSLKEPVLNLEVRTQGLRSTGGVAGGDVDLGPVDATVAVRYLNPDLPAGGLEASLNAAWRGEPPIRALARVRADAAQWLRDYLGGAEVDWADRIGSSPWKLMAKAQKFDLRNVRVGALREADVEGFVTLDVEAGGTLANPSASLSLDLEEFGWQRYRDIFLQAEADLDKRLFRLRTADLEWDADPILRARGTFPTPFDVLFGDAKLEELPVDATIELLELPIAKFSAVDYSFAAIKGIVSGYVRLDGTLTEPEVDGRVAARDIEFSDKSRGSIAMELAVDPKGGVSADVTVCTGPDAILAGAVRLPIDLDFLRLANGETPTLAGEVEASLLGDNVRLARLVPRKVFDKYVSGVSGMMDVDMTLSGTVEEPKLDGRLQVGGGEFFISEFSRGFRDVRLDVTASESRLRVDDVYVADERGHLEGSGELGLDGFLPRRVDASAEIRDFGTTGFTDFAMFVSADVDVGGDFGANGAATATATVSKLEVKIPDSSDQSTLPTTLDSTIKVVRSERDRASLFEFADEGESSGTQPYLRLKVKVERDSWIRHPLATVEVMADMDLQLAPTGVILGGEAQTVRGEAEVLGKVFDIEKGLVTFTGADPPDPLLQIEAVYELERNVTESIGPPTSGEPRAIVRVTGRSSAPQIRFMSDPSMPESDIIYTLVTGRPPSEADAGQTAEASGLAAGAATGLASGLIQEQLGQVLPFNFDVVRFRAGDEGFADPSLEVGKYLTSDVYISIETKFGAEQNENTNLFNIEYRFLPRWILEFEAGNLGTGEANIFWDIY